MKCFTVIATVLLASFAYSASIEKRDDVYVRGVIENLVNSTLNGIIQNLTETIEIDDLPIDLGTNAQLSGYLDLSELKIIGLKSLVATDISVNVLALEVDVKLELTELLLSTNYKADLVALGLVPLYGDGLITITLDEVLLGIHGKAKLGTNSTSINDLAIVIALDDAVFQVTGVLDNTEFSTIVSNVLNDNVAKFINENQDLISGIISPLIENLINMVLENNSVKETLHNVVIPQLSNEQVELNEMA
ncbi:hypothetical protein NQ317_018546 [Molorchus minor]|uniref:Uncharacterized protein n=1 Tax=Molorchus minor TaxID=1323400 RepID=A0ABQ9JW04_9CUCU|nr:hypothetical protein NQ317_018546 [Molorchus minor]